MYTHTDSNTHTHTLTLGDSWDLLRASMISECLCPSKVTSLTFVLLILTLSDVTWKCESWNLTPNTHTLLYTHCLMQVQEHLFRSPDTVPTSCLSVMSSSSHQSPRSFFLTIFSQRALSPRLLTQLGLWWRRWRWWLWRCCGSLLYKQWRALEAPLRPGAGMGTRLKALHSLMNLSGP